MCAISVHPTTLFGVLFSFFRWKTKIITFQRSHDFKRGIVFSLQVCKVYFYQCLGNQHLSALHPLSPTLVSEDSQVTLWFLEFTGLFLSALSPVLLPALLHSYLTLSSPEPMSHSLSILSPSSPLMSFYNCRTFQLEGTMETFPKEKAEATCLRSQTHGWGRWHLSLRVPLLRALFALLGCLGAQITHTYPKPGGRARTCTHTSSLTPGPLHSLTSCVHFSYVLHLDNNPCLCAEHHRAQSTLGFCPHFAYKKTGLWKSQLQ